MPGAYSADRRERVLQADEAGEGSRRELAARFRLSVGPLWGWVGLARREGRRAPRAHGGGRHALNGADPQVLAALGAEQSDAMLTQYCARLAECTGVRVSPAAVCRGLGRLGLRRQKDAARLRAGARRRRCGAGGVVR